MTNPVKRDTQGKRYPTQSTTRDPQPTPGLPLPGPAGHALHGLSRGPAPRTRPGAGDAAPKLHAPSSARAATLPSTRTSPLGLHRSHCRVRRLGYATRGRTPGVRQPGLRPKHQAADPQDVPRAAESEAAADSTGTTTRRPLITTTAHGPGTRRLRPNQWSNLDTQNRTTSGNRVTAHNAHELFIPLQTATFWAKLWLDRRKHLWSSRDAQPLPSTFETLRSRWSLHPFPTLHHSLPHRHVPPFR